MPQSFAEEFKSIPMSPNLGQSLERAHGFAREQSHRLVTLEHLLLALIEDPEAALILQSANVDLARLGTDVSGYLGGLLEDMRTDPGAEPRPDAELLRVLQAAASAAQQSKRRQIDGAIVLAAVVGDGKSPAAGLLKALGMTFEEAIRALQRANTKARLKPAAAHPAAPSARSNGAAEAPDARQLQAAAAPPADDFLAAARARIQQRAAAARGEPAPVPPRPVETPAPPVAAPPESADPPAAAPAAPAPDAEPLEEELLSAEDTEAAAPESAAQRPGRPSWTPPPEPRPPPPVTRPPPQPISRAGNPFPARALQPGEGPPRPPLPPRSAQAGPSPRMPWPDSGERAGAMPPAAANGSLARPYAASGAEPTPAAPVPWSQPAQRGGKQAGRGPLLENVPRRMRVGVPATAEVRIARDKIEGLILALNGPAMGSRPGALVTRALSVRLKAPDGGFWIEPTSPETQWVESALSLVHDDYAAWRWTVLPRQRGRGRLLLTVSARSVGPDGVAGESAPPDRMIEVRVRANHARAALRLGGWIAAISIGVVIGWLGANVVAPAIQAARTALGF